VPSDAKAVLDIRFTEELARTPEELLAKIEEIVPYVEVRSVDSMPLFSSDPADQRIQLLKRIGEEITGQDIVPTFEHGASDLRFFAQVGVPGVIFGCIGDNPHAKEEWVDLESLEIQKRITLEFLKNSS
jgi:succinyl-diaminopimelate desuccinylase